MPSDQRQNATAAISARQQIASAIHIVVTFNFRFGAHNGLKSDIAACPKRAKSGHTCPQRLASNPALSEPAHAQSAFYIHYSIFML
jgi:hypothetical protein